MDKKSFLGFLLIALIIIFLPKYYKMINPKSSKPDSTISSTFPTNIPQVDSIKQDESQFAPSHTKEFFDTPADSIDEQLYKVNTDLYKAVLSNRAGGSLVSFELKGHLEFSDNDTSMVNLINQHQHPNLYIQFFDTEAGTEKRLINNFKLINQHGSNFTVSEEESLDLTFQLIIEGKPVSRTFTFTGNKYYFNLKTNMVAISDNIASGIYKLCWDGGISYTEKNIADENRYSIAYAHTDPDETEKFKLKKAKYESSDFTGKTHWTAIRSKYFTVAMVPEKKSEGYTLFGNGRNIKPDEAKKSILYKYFGMSLNLPKHSVSNTTIYLGPLKKDLLTSIDPKLDNVMSFGAAWIRPISKVVLWLFTNLYKVIPNYGFVIIIFSIFIKILLHPLSVKSTQSMKGMHKLSPLIAELKEKYPNDPKKLNQATMKLYGEHGVNPMGGCLPILLQMPILFALFTVFRTTLELRHAPFVFWITDLSAPDALFQLPFVIPFYGQNFNVLPFILVASQIFMQKMSGQSQNPQQKQMALIMPIMFFFVFQNFPSGLNLYYALFNILTVVQQQYFTPDPKPKTTKTKQKKSRFDRMREIQQKRKNFK